MFLEIDMGNSRIKWRFRDASNVLDKGFIETTAEFDLLAAFWLPYAGRVTVVWVASVVSDELAGLFNGDGRTAHGAGVPGPEQRAGLTQDAPHFQGAPGHHHNRPRLTTHHGSKDHEQHQHPAHGQSMQTGGSLVTRKVAIRCAHA